MTYNRYLDAQERLSRQDKTIVRHARVLPARGLVYSPDIPNPTIVIATLLKAREAYTKAESYRNFSVGACSYTDDGSAMRYVHGANYKDGPGQSEIDVHAEQMVLRRMRAADRIRVFAIIGLPQMDDTSGKQSPTLHPCARLCQPALAESEHITPRTTIITATPDGRAVQWGRLHDYQSFHAGQPDGLQTALFEQTPSVFQPLPPQTGPVVLSEETDIPTDDWDERVTYPMNEWYTSGA